MTFARASASLYARTRDVSVLSTQLAPKSLGEVIVVLPQQRSCFLGFLRATHADEEGVQ